jgi:ribulose-bisphosphate carboxylase large chain
MEEIDRGAQKTGKKTMYAFNITDDIDRMLANHDVVLEAGGTCVMACINLVGFAGVAQLRTHSQLPIHGHRAMIGALMRHPALGIDFVAYQKLARLAGVDHLHTNGMDNKFYESNEEIRISVSSVLAPMFGGCGASGALLRAMGRHCARYS